MHNMSMRYMSAFGAVLLGLLLAGTLDAAPYQELEPREGYVPVYIREGDTPLIEINPKLAEAFNEIDTKNLLEQSNEPELEKKPELILMSVDNGDAMLIAQPADQVMSEDEPMEVIAIVPAPVSESQDESDIAELPPAPAPQSEYVLDDRLEEGEAPQAEPNTQLLEEVRDAIAEEEQQQQQPALEDEEEEEVPEEGEEEEEDKEQPKIEEEEEVGEVPVGPAADDSNVDDDRKVIEDNDKPQEQATDVSTVDAFKTKEIDVKSIETEKIDDVPEEESPATVSIDE